MRVKGFYKIVAGFAAFALPLVVLSGTAYAADPAGVTATQDFIKNVIKIVAGFAGLIATLFIVFGGYSYITSSGNPENLDRAKRTLFWSFIGLAIVIAAFVISNIVTEVATNAFGS